MNSFSQSLSTLLQWNPSMLLLSHDHKKQFVDHAIGTIELAMNEFQLTVSI